MMFRKTLHRIFTKIFRRRVGLDRWLVQRKLSTVFFIFLFVLCIPVIVCTTLFIMECCGMFHSSFLMDRDEHSTFSLPWAVLYHFIDPGSQNMASPGSGRFIAFFLAISGSIFMNGFLISSIVGWYDRFVDKWRCGLARYDETLKRKQFVAIIGAHESVPSIIRQSLKRYEALDYVVVQTNKNVEELRSRLLSYLTAEEERKVIIYAGDRTSKDDILDLQLHPAHAIEVFIMGDSMEDNNYENNHDALNLNCLHIIAEQLRNLFNSSQANEKKKSGRLLCRVMFEYQTSFSIFQYSDISNEVKDIIDFKPMNFYELWAQRVFVNTRLLFEENFSGYLPLEGRQPVLVESEDTVHLVVVGMSRMGVALAIEAARLAHYPNFVRDSRLKSRITFIDQHCHTEMKYFKGRFKELFALSRWREVREDEDMHKLYEETDWNQKEALSDEYYLGEDFIDVEWEFISRGIEDDDVHQYLQTMAQDTHKRFTVAICLPNDNQSVAAALYLPEAVYENAVQVLVYQYHNSAVIDSISIHNRMNQYYKQLKAFGMMKDAYDGWLVATQEYIATVLSKKYDEMYEKVVKAHDIESPRVISTRGKSQIAKYWSNVYSANSIWTKLRSVEYRGASEMDEEHVHTLSITEHNRWVVEQLLMRFRYLTLDEQKEASHSFERKEELKGCKMAHLDICSYDRLRQIDPKVIYLDEGFIKILPEIIYSINHKKNV
jgi:hypothetical protein